MWLSQSTRPDLSTITSILTQYQPNPSPGHLKSAKYAVRYLKGSLNIVISFSRSKNTKIEAFLKFPVPSNTLLPLTDANWGSQDQSTPDPSIPVKLQPFQSRSISGFIIFYNGLIHWNSKRQKITARSSAEAETYATDECVKSLLYLQIILKDMNIKEQHIKFYLPIPVYNDNRACIFWSKSTTTKGLRHITTRENEIRESVQRKFIIINHIAGKLNLDDIFTKELKDTETFSQITDIIAPKIPNITINQVPPP